MMGNQKKIRFVYLLPLFLCWCVASCDLKSTKTNPGESFRKVYDKNSTTIYTALDIKQTADGYIILGMVETHPYLLKVDNQGDFSWDTENIKDFENYENPVPELRISDQEDQMYYFFASKEGEDEILPILPVLLKFRKIENDLKEVDNEISFTNILEKYNEPYFLTPKQASIISDNNYVLMTMNNIQEGIVLVGDEVIDSWMEKVNDISLWAGGLCLESYYSIDRKYHYSGRLKNKKTYYFHSYQKDSYNLELSRCFMIEMEAPDGSEPHPAFKLERPLIAMEWDDRQWDVSKWDGMKLSGAYVSKDKNNDNIVSFFINSKIIMDEETKEGEIEPNEEYDVSELFASKPVYIKTIPVNGQDIVFFAGSTKEGKIGLYTYSLLESEFLGKEYFGEARVYEASGLIDTGDGGLAILGTTYVMNRLKRLCLFKLSETEVKAIAGL